jgi:hypothetical protein
MLLPLVRYCPAPILNTVPLRSSVI